MARASTDSRQRLICFQKEIELLMSRKIDLIGLKFGKLLVLAFTDKYKGVFRWKCVCECGKFLVVRGGQLRDGSRKCCGCVTGRHGEANRTKEYRAWRDAKSRCENPNHSNYKNYGGRGIKMCDRWRNDYRLFLQDMGRAGKGRSLDRINPDGHYEPSNCRWATRKHQARNRRRNRLQIYPQETQGRFTVLVSIVTELPVTGTCSCGRLMYDGDVTCGRLECDPIELETERKLPQSTDFDCQQGLKVINLT